LIYYNQANRHTDHKHQITMRSETKRVVSGIPSLKRHLTAIS
jgi:hypothetical protein